MKLEDLAPPLIPPPYTWTPPVAHDANGTPLDPPPELWGDALPVGIQKEVRAGGYGPDIAVTKDGALYVTVGESLMRSTDYGGTWENIRELLSPEHPQTSDMFSTDESGLWMDPVTQRLFSLHNYPNGLCVQVSLSDDGESWEETLECKKPFLVHPAVVAAPPSPKGLPVHPQGYPNVVYLCIDRTPVGSQTPALGTPAENVLRGLWCSTSLDGGRTWGIETLVSTLKPACAAVAWTGNPFGQPVAFPDGTVAIPLGIEPVKGCTRPLTVVVTEDNGLTWTPRTCREDILLTSVEPAMTVTPDGTAYVLYKDENHTMRLARSTDQFQSCEVFRVSPPHIAFTALPAITSGDDGRIVMAYIGVPPWEVDMLWHAYVAVSFDANAENPTFVTQQVTPNEDPIQVGGISLGVQPVGNLGRTMHLAHDQEGRWYLALTDGCTPRNGCAGRTRAEGDFQSWDSLVSVIVQDRGASLFAQKGILPSLGLTPPQPLGL